MRLALALIIGLAACTSARAADPWSPILDLFRRKPVPTLPAHPPTAPAAIERALIDAELQAAIKRANEAAEKAEEAAKEAARIAAEQVRDSKSPDIKPKAKPRPKPLDIRPVTSAECAQIGIAIGFIGKDGVKREAVARGHSAADIEGAQKACGF